MSSKKRSETSEPTTEMPTATTESQAVEMLEQGVAQVSSPAPEMTSKPASPKQGVSWNIKMAIWEHVDWTPQQIVDHLKTLDIKTSLSSVSGYRSEFIASCRFLAFIGIKGLARFAPK